MESAARLPLFLLVALLSLAVRAIQVDPNTDDDYPIRGDLIWPCVPETYR